eukprot:scaffold8070_cov117-Cylindrotheca_fusiformis.AAC.4
MTAMTHSQSIPIAMDPKASREEADERRSIMMADFQDYLFYSRIVQGIQQRQGKSRCIDLRCQNQALIDHITSTRKADPSESKMFLDPATIRNTDTLSPSVTSPLCRETDIPDDMMFQMDL